MAELARMAGAIDAAADELLGKLTRPRRSRIRMRCETSGVFPHLPNHSPNHAKAARCISRSNLCGPG